MSVRFAMQNDLCRRRHPGTYGLHDHLVHTAEARQRQAEAIAKGARWVWRNARRALERLTNGESREQTPATNGKQISKTLGRASVADAFRRDRQRLARLVRRLILEPYARSRRRNIAISRLAALDDRLLADIGLKRSEIELAVDGKLARDDRAVWRPVEPSLPGEERRHELPQAA
jgi:uncharacterized protein YjiS (DUF1127 family)